MYNNPQENKMSVTTTADEHFDVAREALTKARTALCSMLAGEWGSDQYNQKYLRAILTGIFAVQDTITEGPKE